METSIITKDSVISDLKKLGIQRGDILFLTADLMNIGYYGGSRKETLSNWVEIFNELVGEKGCYIIPSYTSTFLRFKKNSSIVFSKYSPSIAGAFVNFLIKRNEVKRSTHPTHSYVGLGNNVEHFLNSNSPKSLSYSIIGDIINANGKLLMLGTVDKKNAPPAMHYVQEVLGHTQKGPFKGLFQTYFINEKGEKELFTVKDYGGCSRGAYNLYGALIINEAIEFGKVGSANCAIMDGKKSFSVLYDILKDKPEIIRCDDKNCIQCHGDFNLNGINTLKFYLSRLSNLIVIKKGK